MTFIVFTGLTANEKSPKTLATQLELGRLGGFELQLQLVRNQGDELRIGGLALGVGYRIAEEALEGVQIAPIPGDFNGVADGPLHSGRRGLEGLGHLGIQDFCNGVDHIHVVHRDDNGLPQVLIALDVGGNADGVRCHVYGVNALVFIKLV